MGGGFEYSSKPSGSCWHMSFKSYCCCIHSLVSRIRCFFANLQHVLLSTSPIFLKLLTVWEIGRDESHFQEKGLYVILYFSVLVDLQSACSQWNIKTLQSRFFFFLKAAILLIDLMILTHTQRTKPHTLHFQSALWSILAHCFDLWAFSLKAQCVGFSGIWW